MAGQNFHPLFVHFPIALLTVYSLMELLQLRKFLNQYWWFYTKAIFLFIGTVSSFATRQTGYWTKDLLNISSTDELLSAHMLFANTTIWLFSLLSILYLIGWLNTLPKFNNSTNSFWRLSVKIEKLALNNPLIILVALLGLGLITITGALGAAIAYGPTIDPFVTIITQTLIK